MRRGDARARIPARRPLRLALAACLGLSAALSAPAIAADAAQLAVAAPDPGTGPSRNGREIYQRFRDGLADKTCEPGVSSRWRQHFSTAPKRLASREDDLLPLFGYVVDALREAHLPTEYALIPFVESGYKPGARSPSGPAGLWQMIAMTARNHRVPMREGYDGRLSPVESTQAAVRYLKTLHGMFGGDWRLTVMAYNAGEYRVLNAVKRSGLSIADVRHDQLTGLSDITTAYVRKLHALSCLMEQADDREEWLSALDRPVPRLVAVTVPAEIDSIGEWAARTDQDLSQIKRLNPVFGDGRIARSAGKRAPLLAVAASAIGAPGVSAADIDLAAVDPASVDTAGSDRPSAPVASGSSSASTAIASTRGSVEASERPVTGDRVEPAAATGKGRDRVARSDDGKRAGEKSVADTGSAKAQARRHTVGRGDNAWTIAKRYRIRVADLLERNGLAANAVLKPGQALLIDAGKPAGK
ncbi:lytic transglycosylase domain-containing protein [Lysobacter capsici]|uniref:lytic transglycosylase domain-containing protein n=1 Tax=Lysobacter capsici TaxID=435897 RepID=UPI00069C4564|nr:lytic transglycosylase domain-containing protein [Lysobacter capsici]